MFVNFFSHIQNFTQSIFLKSVNELFPLAIHTLFNVMLSAGLPINAVGKKIRVYFGSTYDKNSFSRKMKLGENGGNILFYLEQKITVGKYFKIIFESLDFEILILYDES